MILERNGVKIRVLEERNGNALVIDCAGGRMPYYLSSLEGWKKSKLDIPAKELSANDSMVANQRYTMIADIIPVAYDKKRRSAMIKQTAQEYGLSEMTIRNYLTSYLIYQDRSVLVPNKVEHKGCAYEKEIRSALNKYYYNTYGNSLAYAYRKMIKEMFIKNGVIQPHPSLSQFRYYHRTHKNMARELISRDGIGNYQRNERPILGTVQDFANTTGTGLLDATICDIYLVNDEGQLVGRPILTACVDAYSGLCCGYSLDWEGGNYSLRNLMINVITDKKKYCKQFGIVIKDEWPCNKLPAKLVTDRGSEYVSQNFGQIAELGVTLVNLPAYRPDLKSKVEKFFDVIQNYYKPILKGRGVIEPDWQERGSVDYRRQACLTMRQFEIIILECIIFYNSRKTVEFPMTEEMIGKVKPYRNHIWNSARSGNLLSVSREQLVLTLLPRTEGRFTRKGLVVNGMRYCAEGCNESYLKGGSVEVAYNPDDVSRVWLHPEYKPFELVDSRFKDKSLEAASKMKQDIRSVLAQEQEKELEEHIALIAKIEAISDIRREKLKPQDVKNVRKVRQTEQKKSHKGVAI